MNVNLKSVIEKLSVSAFFQVIIYIISFIKTKCAALYLGSAGVGSLDIYTNIIMAATNVGSLGVGNSSVVLLSKNSKDKFEQNSYYYNIKLICSLMSFVTFLGYYIFSLSVDFYRDGFVYFFEGERLLISLTSLFVILTIPIHVYYHGKGETKKYYLIQTLSQIINLLVSVVFFVTFGFSGILYSIVYSSIVNYIVIFFLERRLIPLVKKERAPDIQKIKSLVGLGGAIIWSNILSASVALCIRLTIMNNGGLEMNGIYHASLALSALFTKFVISAMNVQYYPDLVHRCNSLEKDFSIISSYTLMSVMIVSPCLLLTSVASESLVTLFYSSDFYSAASIISIFVIGSYFEVLCYPVGMVMQAKEKKRLLIIYNSAYLIVYCTSSVVMYMNFGIVGLAIAYAVCQFSGWIVSSYIATKLIKWKPNNMIFYCVFSVPLIIGSFYNYGVVETIVLIFCMALLSFKISFEKNEDQNFI